MMNTIKAMNDETLTFVTGGDNGDAKKDTNSYNSKYLVGHEVYVYLTGLHFLYQVCKIVAKTYSPVYNENGSLEYYCWHYKVTGTFSNEPFWITADDINS